MKQVNSGRIQVNLHDGTFALKTKRANCLSITHSAQTNLVYKTLIY